MRVASHETSSRMAWAVGASVVQSRRRRTRKAEERDDGMGNSGM
jgi:hypothetical protein